ncbi:spore germination protein [Paenibacillus pinisoli]|uniref:Spore germination protein n=1 Tax=Paenibacillus pinisoli TaxID=1276110 RepID=A0A3A6PH42_9BACL|nr:spore germination protein [Paenibacillus pinisoli]RJX40457.1 spore germination protein [Paenibacillus pinisoli]
MAPNGQGDSTAGNDKLSADLDTNLKQFQAVFDKCGDIQYRPFELNEALLGTFIFLSGLGNINAVNMDLLRNAIESSLIEQSEALTEDIKAAIHSKLGFTSQTSWSDDFQASVDKILAGELAVLLDGFTSILLLNVKELDTRSIEEPATESVIRGPRDGFQENISTNISLIRRRLKTTQLKLEMFTAGKLSVTDIAIAYLEGIAEESLIAEVKERVGRIKIDAILESGYVEELIEDNSVSPFPQVMVTERPDKVVGNLLEGKVAIIVDNTPFVIVVPGTFFQLLQTPEDYYQRYFVASAIRILRFIAVVSSLLLPSLYIALTTYHHEMIPTMLLISIASSRETVPFPAFVEAMLMEVAFEGLREAGVRLPRPVGQGVSIVGALVIGQAAVAAGIVSSPLLIIVSMTGIASFLFPSFQLGLAFRLLRFPMMIAAATFGLYGILMLMLMLLLHMLHLQSFGVPYMSPLSPLRAGELKDVLYRANWLKMSKSSKSRG